MLDRSKENNPVECLNVNDNLSQTQSQLEAATLAVPIPPPTTTISREHEATAKVIRRKNSNPSILQAFFDFSSTQLLISNFFSMGQEETKEQVVEEDITSQEGQDKVKGQEKPKGHGSQEEVKGPGKRTVYNIKPHDKAQSSGNIPHNITLITKPMTGGPSDNKKDPATTNAEESGSTVPEVSQYSVEMGDSSVNELDDPNEPEIVYHTRRSGDNAQNGKKKKDGDEDNRSNLNETSESDMEFLQSYHAANPDGSLPPPHVNKMGVQNSPSGSGWQPLPKHASSTPMLPVGTVSKLIVESDPAKKPQRRSRIPNRPNISMSLWGILKNAIGSDLSKMPLPVNFNEPLSMLQRLTEDYEYSAILDKAAKAKDSCEQLAYVAAFTVSSYASTAVRTGKPFNPLLGETFECDRMAELGWKCFSEQVSHHPPTAAQYCSGNGWVCWQEFTMTSRFRGNYLQVTPLGIAHLLFKNSGNHYTWRKVSTMVHNIMVGKLWIDQEGDMDIFNHKTGDICHLKYIPTGFFKSESKKVEGTVINVEEQPKYAIEGYWDSKIESYPILKVDGSKRTLGPAKLLWSRNLPPPDCDKYYFFTELACQLNEMDDSVAPTDSRRRPDQRRMENGDFDSANAEKLRLEEKQRAAKKRRLIEIKSNASTARSSATTSHSQSASTAINIPVTKMDGGEPGYKPAWFTMQIDSITGKPIHVFLKDYWEYKAKGDFSRCPDLF